MAVASEIASWRARIKAKPFSLPRSAGTSDSGMTKKCIGRLNRKTRAGHADRGAVGKFGVGERPSLFNWFHRSISLHSLCRSRRNHLDCNFLVSLPLTLAPHINHPHPPYPNPRHIASFFISIFLLADTSETVYFTYLSLFFFFCSTQFTSFPSPSS